MYDYGKLPRIAPATIERPGKGWNLAEDPATGYIWGRYSDNTLRQFTGPGSAGSELRNWTINTPTSYYNGVINTIITTAGYVDLEEVVIGGPFRFNKARLFRSNGGGHSEFKIVVYSKVTGLLLFESSVVITVPNTENYFIDLDIPELNQENCTNNFWLGIANKSGASMLVGKPNYTPLGLGDDSRKVFDLSNDLANLPADVSTFIPSPEGFPFTYIQLYYE